MKKIYKKPLAKIIELETESICFDGSGGVGDDGSVGRSYDSSAESYTNSYRKKLWED